MFAKIPDHEPVKTRLRLSRSESTRFHWASLADVLETACRVVEQPVLFVSGGSESEAGIGAALGRDLAAAGLPPDTWSKIRLAPQQGEDLGARMENALALLLADRARAPRHEPRRRGDSPAAALDAPRALLLGSDSPSLSAEKIRSGLAGLDRADVVLGPAADGGFWSIGVRRVHRGFLAGLPWSSSDTLDATRARATELGLRVLLLEGWTDVDRPEDLRTLAAQIAALRAARDALTARHSERFLRGLGRLDANDGPGGGSSPPGPGPPLP